MIPGILASMFVIPKGNVFYGVVVTRNTNYIVEYKNNVWTVKNNAGAGIKSSLSQVGTFASIRGGGGSQIDVKEYDGSQFVNKQTMTAFFGDGNPYGIAMSGNGQFIYYSTFSNGIYRVRSLIKDGEMFKPHDLLPADFRAANMMCDYHGNYVYCAANSAVGGLMTKVGNVWTKLTLPRDFNKDTGVMSSTITDDELRIVNFDATRLLLHRVNTTTNVVTDHMYNLGKTNTSDMVHAIAISGDGKYAAVSFQVSGIQNGYIKVYNILESSLTVRTLPIMYGTVTYSMAMNADGSVLYLKPFNTTGLEVYTRASGTTSWTRRPKINVGSFREDPQSMTAN